MGLRHLGNFSIGVAWKGYAQSPITRDCNAASCACAHDAALLTSQLRDRVRALRTTAVPSWELALPTLTGRCARRSIVLRGVQREQMNGNAACRVGLALQQVTYPLKLCGLTRSCPDAPPPGWEDGFPPESWLLLVLHRQGSSFLGPDSCAIRRARHTM